jgi:predicted amidohydrolase
MPAPTIAALELPGAGGTLDERLDRADAALRRAEADVVVLPEAYLPGYSHVRADAATTAQTWMADRARRHAATIIMGYLDDDACVLGVTTPDGRHTRYQKRFLAPAEARVWRAGTAPVIADTPAGRIGLLICADVLQLQAWDAYIGRVDAVAVAAAWPDYAGRIDTVPAALRVPAKWLFEASNPYRRVLLGRAAIAVGAPVAYAAATGPYRDAEQFSGHACIYAADGRVVATGAVSRGPIARRPPGPALRHTPAWAAFTAAYRAAARLAPALGA